MEKMSIEALLALDKYVVDEDYRHIEVDLAACLSCTNKPCLYTCPAKCYAKGDSDQMHFDYAGCLECGTCRLTCRQLGAGGVIKWTYPRGTFGVSFRYA